MPNRATPPRTALNVTNQHRKNHMLNFKCFLGFFFGLHVAVRAMFVSNSPSGEVPERQA
jgi:hypothetical protein